MKKALHDTFHKGLTQEVKVNIFKLSFDDMDAPRFVGFLHVYFR